MRQLGFALATLVFAASFVGCPLLKKKAPEEEEDPPVAAPVDAATVQVTGTGAKNESSILRYANETAINNEPAVIAKNGTVARNFPGNGPTVAVLNQGQVVAKVASYFSTGVLVMFDDPSGDGSKLLGWVPPKAFDLAAPPPTRTVVVPPPAPRPTVVVVDAGKAPTVVDAGGGTAVVDAGGGGGGLPQPKAGTVAVAPVNGKCPDGWAISENMCRHKCAADSECPRGTKCVQKGGPKVCTSDR